LNELTCSRSSGHTLSSGAVDGASILLQGLVGEAAVAVGCLAGLDIGASDAVDTLDIGDGGGRDGDEAKENGMLTEVYLVVCLFVEWY
jgi:hypothetical protein